MIVFLVMSALPSVHHFILSANELARILHLVIVLVVLLLLHPLRRLPTAWFTLIVIPLLIFKSHHSLLLHRKEVRIILSICISQLGFLNVIGWGVKDDRLIRNHSRHAARSHKWIHLLALHLRLTQYHHLVLELRIYKLPHHQIRSAHLHLLTHSHHIWL